MDYMQHANILTEALPHIQALAGKIVVIKYGGNAMITKELCESVASDIVLMQCVGIKPVIVHGGGPYITQLLDKMNVESKFIDGLRYSDENTIDTVKMILGGKVNKELVNLIQQLGGAAIGLCGLDGSFIKAKKIDSDIDLGYVGEITSVDTTLIENIINSGYIPVIGSMATSEDSKITYNINADTCATKVASTLNAEKLILLTNVPGLLQNPKDNKTLISQLRLHEIKKLENEGIIQGGMIPKIDCCVEAIRNGVKKTHIIDGTTKHSILLELLSNEGIGTMIY